MLLDEVILQERVVDIVNNIDGLGATPNNQDIDYLGARALMTPTDFRILAESFSPNRENIEYMVGHLENGGTIGAPHLDIVIPEEWLEGDYEYPAFVIGHEGRHRMVAVGEVFGSGAMVETHFKFRTEERELRARHLDLEALSEGINQHGLVKQDFSHVHGKGYTNDDVPGLVEDVNIQLR